MPITGCRALIRCLDSGGLAKRGRSAAKAMPLMESLHSQVGINLLGSDFKERRAPVLLSAEFRHQQT